MWMKTLIKNFHFGCNQLFVNDRLPLCDYRCCIALYGVVYRFRRRPFARSVLIKNNWNSQRESKNTRATQHAFGNEAYQSVSEFEWFAIEPHSRWLYALAGLGWHCQLDVVAVLACTTDAGDDGISTAKTIHKVCRTNSPYGSQTVSGSLWKRFDLASDIIKQTWSLEGTWEHTSTHGLRFHGTEFPNVWRAPVACETRRTANYASD